MLDEPFAPLLPPREPEELGPVTEPSGVDAAMAPELAARVDLAPAPSGPFALGLHAELWTLYLRFAREGLQPRDAADPAEHARVAVAELLRCFFVQLAKYGRATALGRPYRFEVNAGLLADECVILRVGRAAQKANPARREMSEPDDVFP